ncbi:hypothetical protein K402DRAFT_410399 [Aulographum hederae CBS 113979]|uniref:Zn(2)-C6 fungal-type domain-containing protein n=1 Tax=Aulographum hederae CBS 113979 TaxID=1176131 RepID=A0A6G1HAU4_9PEZI|nr:hypothetical protein K402DRAFT_410399 [Aulographum hederae CBS 113979]
MASSAIDPALYGAHQSRQQQQPPYYPPPPQVPPQHPRTAHFDPVLEKQQEGEDHEQSPDDGHDEGHEDEDEGEHADSASHTSPSSRAPDAKRPRACDSCRGLKVRCIIDPASGQPCRRCARAGRRCIVTPPTRKRQKKADSRVAELERKIDALTASLQARENGVPERRNSSVSAPSPYDNHHAQYQPDRRLLGEAQERPSASPYSRQPTMEASPATAARKRRRVDDFPSKVMTRGTTSTTGTLTPPQKESSEEEVQTMRREMLMSHPGATIPNNYNERKPIVFDHSDIDGKISAIVDKPTAERLFDHYIHDVSPYFPAVPIAPGTNPQTFREQKPILFLAIISSICFGVGIPHEAQQALARELREQFAESMWKQGEKSLELIQALQVSTLWYRPPSNFEQHMFFQMVHMSAIMAIDIGMGKRQSQMKRKWFGQDPPFRRLTHMTETAEARRAWLVSYFLCISITMVLRRPILLRFNEYMRECIEYLENAPDALPSDKLLVQHVKLARIAEEISIQFSMDDPNENLSISDGKVTYGIKHFEKDLREQVHRDTVDPSLRLGVFVTDLYIHEIALHYNQNVEDFHAPFTEGSKPHQASQPILGTHHVDALGACQLACRHILDEFLGLDFHVLYALPIIFSVRVVYTLVVLIKLYVAATTPGEMESIIKKDELRVDSYLAALEHTFGAVMNRDPLSPSSKFLFVVQRLKDRYMSIKRGESGPAASRARAHAKKERAKSEQHGGHPKSARARSVTATQDMKPAMAPPTGAQGLQLLSEVAMGNSGNGASPPQAASASAAAHQAAHQQQQQQQHQHQQQWYAAQQAQQQQAQQAQQATPNPGMSPEAMAAAAAGGMDPSHGYPYGGGAGVPFTGLENIDFGFGTGMGDADLSGLFMADLNSPWWSLTDPNLQGGAGGQGYPPGWS